MRTGLVAAEGMTLGPAFWQEALAVPARRGRSPYGPLGPPDANGARLPAGFRSRIVARGGTPVAGTGYGWHIFPDGAGTFRARDGGWILVSNSEVPTAVDVPGPITGDHGDAARARSASTPRARSSMRTGSSPVRARTAPVARRLGEPGCRARSTRRDWYGNATRRVSATRWRARLWERSSTRRFASISDGGMST